MTWNIRFLNYEGEKWVPIPELRVPVIQYSGYCRPLTAEHFQKPKKVQSEGK